MKRRGFLGFLGAGAVAGPSIAKQAAASINTVPITGGASVLGTLTEDVSFPTPAITYSQEKANYLVQRANELRRLISGEQEDPGNQYQAGRLRQQQLEPSIHCLASVSHTYKVRMVLHANRRLEKEWQRRTWIEELLNIERSN